MRQTNDELESKARLLEEQKVEVETKNREVEKARKELEDKAAQLTVTSKYKSEFLSNMSHELRTPLNSLIILSQQLKDNTDKNLSEKQVQYASTIYNSGNDLLALINEILDLSKIESGTVQLDLKTFPLAGVHDEIDRTFRHIAHQKNLSFDFEAAPGSPDTMTSDRARLMQILKNLLSNAIKFTATGGVKVRVSRETSGWSYDRKMLNEAGMVVAFRVADTGIGIPEDKQKIVFEAFQQADSGTSRKFGGTGLGLSISRELAALLGGEVQLEASEPGKGSTFVLYIPQEYPGTSADTGFVPNEGPVEPPPEKNGVAAAKAKDTLQKRVDFVPDDMANIKKGDLVLLIAENDAAFAKILVEMARKKGFKCVVTPNGNDILKLCRQYNPDAITLDLLLEDINGWLVLDSLKSDPDLRHIPVDIISVEENRMQGLNRGAYQYLIKSEDPEKISAVLGNTKSFLKRKVKDLLLVEPDKNAAKRMAGLIGEPDISIQTAPNGKTAVSILKKKSFDCVVLNADLPDMPGLDLIAGLSAPAEGVVSPVIVYSGRPFTEKENTRIKELSAGNVVKKADSDDHLLEETALFLHRVIKDLPEPKRKAIEKVYQAGGGMAGKKVLIVDDDMRNIFALTAALERYGMEVLSAEDGKKALDILEAKRGIDIVLMDIMMPEMDGYEVMRRIRKIKRFQALPVIALTAKAMKGDRDKCIAAGASDYVSKPVNVEQLAGLMRMWLNR